MKRTLLLISFVMMVAGLFAQGTYYQMNVNKSGQVTYQSSVNDINTISFGDGTAIISGTTPATYSFDDIDSITFNAIQIATGDTVFVTYNGNSVEIINPHVNDGVSVTTSGANVSVSSVGENIIYCLSGTSTNGSIAFTSITSFTLVLRNLNLTSGAVPAIGINSAVNVTMPLIGTSTIADGSGTQDAAFWTDGSITTAGTGTLAVTGNRKHAFDIEGSLTHSTGTLKVNNAQSDAFHIDGDFFTSGNSVIQIAQTAADGFDINGNVNIQGGSITINAPGIAGRGLRTKGILNMSNGTLDITATGDTTRAIKSTGKANITGGNITLDIQGYGAHGISSDTEVAISGTPIINITSASVDGKCIKSDSIVNISGGNFTIVNTAADGKGIKADNNLSISGGTIGFNFSGNNANCISSDTDVTINGGTINITSTSLDGKGIASNGTININGGNINITHSGNTSKGIKADGDINITNGTFVINSNGTTVVTSGDPSYCTAIKSDANINISGGNFTITLPTANKGGKGIKSSGNMTISGNNTINITTNGYGATYTATSGSDVYSSTCLRSEGNMQILSGNITLVSNGAAGKGIKVGTKTASGSGWGGTTYTYTGTYTQGNSDGTGPTLSVSTTGSEIGSSGGGPGGGSSTTAHASAKAIKVGGLATIYGGTTTVSTTKSGAEGLESKTQIKFEGGQHYFKCYDDCINSAGKIFFNGGVVVCYGYGNDAIDSNAGQSGAITIGNGAVLTYTTKGSPEEGFDCDNNSYIQITGNGIGISAGGSQGGGGGPWGGGGSSSTISGAVQGYYFYTSSVTFQTGKYYTVSNQSGSGGTNYVTFSFEANCSSNLALITATGMAHNSTYYVKSGNTAPTNPTTAFHGLYIGGTSSASTQVFSFTAQ